MRRRHGLVFGVLMCVVVALLPAQQDDRSRVGVPAPEETDITLPETFLEVEEVLIERVDAALPATVDLLPPILSVPLPTEDELRVSDVVFDIPGLDDPLSRGEPGDGESSFFSDGVLGTGTNYHILGSLSLFKLGVDPRFRFEFAHESIDGYQFKAPGSGYFHRADTIEGWIASGIARRGSIEADARFFQREEGLQNQPDGFYSAGHRYLSGNTDFSYALTNRFEFGLGAAAGRVERIFTVKDADADPPREEEFFVQPSVSLSYRRSSFLLALHGDGEYRAFGGGELDTVQSGYGGLSAEVAVRDALFVEASAGGRIASGEELLFPFRLAATANLDDTFTLGIHGGYRVEPQRFFELWQRVPLLSFDPDGASRPKSERAWYGGMTAAWARPDRRFTVEAGSELAVRSNTLELSGYDGDETTYGFRQVDMVTLKPNVMLTWRLGAVELGAGWQAHLMDRSVLDPGHSVTGSLEAIHSSERFGANIEARLDIFEEPMLPRLGAGGFFNVAHGVQFLLELRDLLAPGLPDGRPQIGSGVSGDYPFIEPGFRLILKAQVSL